MEGPSTNGAKFITAIAWPVLMLLGLIMLSAVGLVATAILAPGPETGGIAKLIGQANAITRLAALLIVAPLIGVLAILERVDGSAAIAALSAVVGFLLGSTGAPP